MVTGTCYRAVNYTIAAIRAGGALEAVDEALVALVRSTARSVDEAPRGSAAAASCARAHLLALDRLRGLTQHDDGDAIDRMLAQLADGGAAVGDTEEPGP
jgi:hypothetical protein